jgi:hypothetical protein
MRTLLVTAALFMGVAGTASADKAKKAPGEDWKISGWETTTCCCKDICPCRYNEKPTHMECESFIAVHVDKGFYGKTKLDDVNFILAGRGFDENGGWNKVYMDKKVSPAEQKAVVGILTSMISSYKPESAKRIFGSENRGMEVVAMTFKKSKNGLVREINAPGVCSIKARLGKVPNSSKPMHILGVLTEFSPIFYPAAEVSARADAAVGYDHPEHHRAEVEDFTLTRDDYATRRIGFQAYTGKGGCLLPGK